MRKWLQHQTHRQVVVTTKSGESLDGLLAIEARDGIVLRAARLLRGSDPAIPVDGEVFVPRENVAVMQFVHLDQA